MHRRPHTAPPRQPRPPRVPARFTLALVALAGALSACGAHPGTRTLTVTTTVPAPPTVTLPGTGKPAVTIGDKNYTEQFLLGELYYLALRAQGYSVSLNRNIGPTEVTMSAMQNGTLSMYPEYLQVWNASVAGYPRRFPSQLSALRAGRRYALAHGFELLNPSPFSDTSALAVDFNYGIQHGVAKIGDLRKVAAGLAIGAPPQFQQDPNGLPAITRAYGVAPAVFKPLAIGAQYQALQQGQVQVADVNSTDGELITGNYTLLEDPLNVFGWGNVVPVVALKVLQAEGPQFAATVNRVTALLTTAAMRQMNAAVDLDNQDPATVAQQFLQAHGLLPSP